MQGSLGVWYNSSAAKTEGHEPKVELHFNLWRDLPHREDALDVGIMLKDARTVEEFCFYFPGEINASCVQDLSSILEDQTTLSAVFNDTLEVRASDHGSFEALRTGAIAFHVWSVDFSCDQEAAFRMVPEEQYRGTVVTFCKPLFQKMTHVGAHYLRFRINFNEALSTVFVNAVPASDRVFLSSFDTAESVEFRLNEKRNFGPQLRSMYKVMRMPEILAVHYLLVRKLNVELVQAHATFRKIRRLEKGLWDKYLVGLGSPVADEMLIYHWRELTLQKKSIEDFAAFVTFRAPRNNILIYVWGILLLGSAGSALQSIFQFAFSPRGKSATVWPNLISLLIPSALLILTFFWVTKLSAHWHRLGIAARGKRWIARKKSGST